MKFIQKLRGKRIIGKARTPRAADLYECECGNRYVTRRDNPRQRCHECFHRQEHGLSGTRVYGIWKAIKSRCYNENDPDYYYYGARGVHMCDGWLNNPTAFAEWAIANGYEDHLTIDKDKLVQSNLTYGPDTCCWLTIPEQMQHKREYVRH